MTGAWVDAEAKVRDVERRCAPLIRRLRRAQIEMLFGIIDGSWFS